MNKLASFLTWIGLLWRYWPKVQNVVRYVEAIQDASTGEAKKAMAKQLLQKELPAPPGWCDADWDAFLGGLVDAIVAVLHWRGIFKHSPGHPCYREGKEG